MKIKSTARSKQSPRKSYPVGFAFRQDALTEIYFWMGTGNEEDGYDCQTSELKPCHLKGDVTVIKVKLSNSGPKTALAFKSLAEKIREQVSSKIRCRNWTPSSSLL